MFGVLIRAFVKVEFETTKVFRERYFKIGIVKETDKAFISVPFDNGGSRYSEYFEIDKSLLENSEENVEKLSTLASECLSGKYDHKLLYTPLIERQDRIPIK